MPASERARPADRWAHCDSASESGACIGWDKTLSLSLAIGMVPIDGGGDSWELAIEG